MKKYLLFISISVLVFSSFFELTPATVIYPQYAPVVLYQQPSFGEQIAISIENAIQERRERKQLRAYYEMQERQRIQSLESQKKLLELIYKQEINKNIWENFWSKDNHKSKMIVWGIFILSILISLFFLIIFGLKLVKKKF